MKVITTLHKHTEDFHMVERLSDTRLKIYRNKSQIVDGDTWQLPKPRPLGASEAVETPPTEAASVAAAERDESHALELFPSLVPHASRNTGGLNWDPLNPPYHVAMM